MADLKRVCIIGAGPLGLLSARMLSKDGYDVVLVEKEPDILLNRVGPPANILHKNGLEYLKKGRPQTGYDCVDAGVAIDCVYGSSIRSRVIHEQNMANFYLVDESTYRITPQDMIDNARDMQRRYDRDFQHAMKKMKWDRPQAAAMLSGLPENFIEILGPDRLKDVSNIACGIASPANGLSMEAFYMHWKHGILPLKEFTVFTDTNTEEIYKNPRGDGYIVKFSNADPILADYVVITAGYDTPNLVYKTKNPDGSPVSGPTGHYLLNCMAQIELPPVPEGSDQQKFIHSMHFGIQGPDGGASFVCKTPPTSKEWGLAVSYVPRIGVSQIQEYEFDPSKNTPAPDWGPIIKNELKPAEKKKIGIDEEERAIEVIKTLGHYYGKHLGNGYLRSEYIKFKYGAVMTKHGPGVNRAQREIGSVTAVTKDGRVSASHAGKFTTSPADAAQVLWHIRCNLESREPLPQSDECGVGPNNIDLIKSLEDVLLSEVVLANLAQAHKTQALLERSKVTGERGGGGGRGRGR